MADGMTRSRLELARTVTAQLRRREGHNLLAVGLYGSVSRGEDRAHSDIDLVLLVRSGKTGLQMLMRNGVLVALLRLTRDEAADEVRGYSWNLPEALSGWRSVQELYDPRGLLRSLRDRSLRPRAHQFREAARGGFLGTFEDYGKLLNALEAEDAAEAREMAIWFTHGAAMILLCLERQVASTGRRVFAELPNQRGVGNAIRRLRYETLPLDETTRLARSVWTSLRSRARTQRIALPERGQQTKGSPAEAFSLSGPFPHRREGPTSAYSRSPRSNSASSRPASSPTSSACSSTQLPRLSSCRFRSSCSSCCIRNSIRHSRRSPSGWARRSARSWSSSSGTRSTRTSSAGWTGIRSARES